MLPNYNILTEAGSTFGYKHTEVSRIKMKTNYSQERRNTIGNLNKNKSINQLTRLKMREKALSIKSRVFTKETEINMKKKSRPIIL